MAPVMSALSRVNDLCMGGVSGACLSDGIITGIPQCDCVWLEIRPSGSNVTRAQTQVDMHVNVMKILLADLESSKMDRQAHMAKLMGAFYNVVAKTPKIDLKCVCGLDLSG
jgi:hypothetical protein